MITWVRSGNINHGKRAGAIEWALRVSAYVNDAYGTNIIVKGNVAGPTNQIHWVVDYESLAAFEEIVGKLGQDEGYHQLLAESTAANFFDTHSFNDSMFQSLG